MDARREGGVRRIAVRLLRTALLVVGSATWGCDCRSAGSDDGSDGWADADAQSDMLHGDAEDADVESPQPDGEGEDGSADSDADARARLSCGDGTLDPGEECDDGNRLDGDGCDWMCRFGDGDEPPVLPPDPDAGHLESDPSTEVVLDTGAAHPEAIADRSRVPLEWTGTVFATVWVHHGPSYPDPPYEGTFLRFDREGTRLDSVWNYLLQECEARTSADVSLEWNGSGFGFVWYGIPSPSECSASYRDWRLMFLALDVDGKPLGDPVAVIDSSWTIGLGLAADDSGYGCVGDFVLTPASGSEAFRAFYLIDRAGSPRLSGPTTLGQDRFLYHGMSGVAWSGSSFLVTWSDEPRGEEAVRVARYAVLAPDGRLLTSIIGLVDNACEAEPDVVWTGEEFGVVWCDYDPWTSEGRLWLARVSADGEMLEPPSLLFDSADPTAFPVPFFVFDLTFGHRTYTVAWPGGFGISLWRWDRNGTFVESVESRRSAGDIGYGTVGVAADDEGFGVIAATFEATGIDSGQPLFLHYRVLP